MRLIVDLDETDEHEKPIIDFIRQWLPLFENAGYEEDMIAYAMLHYCVHVVATITFPGDDKDVMSIQLDAFLDALRNS